MHAFQDDGFVVDTPGLRDVGLWGMAPAEVAAAFPDFSRFSRDCRFDNCRHLSEPGCEVIQAAARGDLAATRLHSYRLMLSEASHASQSW
jgi:ribosome biogenesis GTPase